MEDRFKYRVHSKKHERYIDENEAIYVYILPNGEIIAREQYIETNGLDADRPLHPEDFIIEFCTGLKDKKGTLIYEGDILQNIKNNKVATVQWHGTMASFAYSYLVEDKKATREWDYLFRAFDKFEIIGNIYETPELLGGGE